jgi:hypothetical protein
VLPAEVKNFGVTIKIAGVPAADYLVHLAEQHVRL